MWWTLIRSGCGQTDSQVTGGVKHPFHNDGMRRRLGMLAAAIVAGFVVSAVLGSSAGAVVASERWRPAAGQTYLAGWKLIEGATEATYHPCQTVTWFFDRNGEPADRVRMIDDVRGGLSFLEGPSGLKFVETTDPAQAMLTFKWADLTGQGADVLGTGGPVDVGKAEVDFSNNAFKNKDLWAGRGTVRFDDPADPENYFYQGEGRQTVVVHEVLHGMGFGHVDDVTSIMHPSASNGTTLNAGDLSGLHTLYLGNACPIGQVCVANSNSSWCDLGATWAYAQCWSDATGARLQERKKKKWVNVRPLQVVQNDASCTDPKYPDRVAFEFVTNTPGKTDYRVVTAGPRGTKPAYDNLAVTRS